MLTDSSVHSLTELSTYLYIHSFIHLSFSWTHYYSFLFLIHPSIHSSSRSSGRNCWDIMFCFLFSWLIIHAYPSILWLSHLSTHFLSIYPSSTSIYICIHPYIQCLYCLSIHLSIYLSVYLFICFFIHSFFYPHNCLFFNLSIYPTLPLIHSCHLLSIHLSKHPAIPHMSISLLVYLFSYFKSFFQMYTNCLSIHPSIDPSIKHNLLIWLNIHSDRESPIHLSIQPAILPPTDSSIHPSTNPSIYP